MGKPETFANRSRGVLEGAINNAVTTLTLETGDGAAFPSDGNFRIRIDDEIMIVGARASDTLSSITRGAEGTAAASHADGAEVTHPLTAGALLLAHQSSRGGGTFIHPSEFSIPVMMAMPWKGSFIGWEVINYMAGTVQFDVWKCAPGDYDAGVTHPVDGDSITAADQPKTTAAARATGSCTGWDVDFDEGDIIWIVCDSGQSTHSTTVLLEAVRTV